MVIEIKHRNSSTIYEDGEAYEHGISLFHATIGDRVHYPDGSTKELSNMEEVSAWLQELYFSDRLWWYDGRKNWRRVKQ